jgi:hypothetical protein
MSDDKTIQKRIYPEFRRMDRGVVYQVIGILSFLIGFVVLAWNVVLVVSGRDSDRLLYILIGLVIMVGGVWAFGVDLREWLGVLLHRRAWRRLQVSAEAEILTRDTKKHTDEYGQVHYTYWVTFRFPSADGPVTLKAQVYKPQYERLKEVETVPVRYALENPRIALLEGED